MVYSQRKKLTDEGDTVVEDAVDDIMGTLHNWERVNQLVLEGIAGECDTYIPEHNLFSD